MRCTRGCDQATTHYAVDGPFIRFCCWLCSEVCKSRGLKVVQLPVKGKE